MYDPSKLIVVICSGGNNQFFKMAWVLINVCMYFFCREISKCFSLLQCQQLKITGVAVQTKNSNPRPKVFIRYFVES